MFRLCFSVIYKYFLSSTFIIKAENWVNKILSYPGIDEKSLAQKKIYWLASVSVTSWVFCLTLAYHIIFPQLTILIYYGLFVTLIFLQGVVFPFMFGQKYDKMQVGLMFINQTLVAIATFFCILKLGGIPYSGGLVIVGLAMVFFSLNFRKKKHSLGIFIIYVITVILEGILHPRLNVPPEMTQTVNISLYVINLLWISGFVVIFVMSFISQSVKLEQMEANRIKELDEVKTKLYTNITHEFRTPLTIITGMTNLIRDDPGNWLEEGSVKIDRSAGILLNLVNQMLDLSKLEAGALPVRMVRADINLYLKYIVELFRSVAAGKKIELNYKSCNQHAVIDYDPDKLMQIISNLLSNALKFTQNCGVVDVATVLTGDGKFKIRISDNGPGIPETHLPFIFDRFYRVGGPDPGSGLGLALTRELVKLLGGTITADSIYGEGSEFTVSLPVTYNAPLEEVPEINKMKESLFHHIISEISTDSLSVSSSHTQSDKPILLVVEDNNDVVQYLLTFLKNEYDVHIAANGLEGLQKAIESVPDIILSDIMMPIMDGIEMLERVKSDFRTSHIPVVMLTAKVDIGSRLEGLERGADAYIAKPFIKEELLIQLRSLIYLRKRLQERYAPATHLQMTEEQDFQPEDTFIEKIRDVLLANISNESFHIDRLCKETAMSRTQLYRKFRSLTDKTISEYFRTLRLHKARELLNTTEISVSEAAYKTGFKNVSHFSRVFTQSFGINPREFRK